MVCAIWGTPAAEDERTGDFRVIDSPRAGGKYWISGTAVAQIGSWDERAKRLITTWLCEQRRSGAELPKLSSNVLEAIKARQLLPVGTRMTKALEFLGAQISELGGRLRLGGGDDATLVALAETESKHIGELAELFRMLDAIGYVQGQHLLDGSGIYQPTAQGWQELDKLKLQRTDSSQAFVAMWFSSVVDAAYSEGIAPALSVSGYRPVRIDKKEHNNKIDDEIIAEIRRSRFLIADFTCEPKNVRGGVYYEAGFAQGLGMPVIWTCKDTSIGDLHFDTRQYSHIIWKTPEDLFIQLKNRIGATVGDGPLPKPNANSA